MSESSRPHGLSPIRLLRSWDFPGKSAGVDCHFSRDLPYPGIKPGSPTLRADALLSEPPGTSLKSHLGSDVWFGVWLAFHSWACVCPSLTPFLGKMVSVHFPCGHGCSGVLWHDSMALRGRIRIPAKAFCPQILFSSYKAFVHTIDCR